MKTLLFSTLLFCICASGSYAKRIVLNILHTSDTHSRILPIPDKPSEKYRNLGGVVRRDAIIRNARTADKATLVFDCGDFCQGTPFFNMFRGDVEVSCINAMGYDAVAIGNHEFDFGLENMARIYRKLKCPVVCTNYDFTDTPLQGIVQPYVILKRHGLRIGVLGLGPKLKGLVQSKKYGAVVYRDPVEIAQQTADFLRQEKRCDVVIILSHLGYQVLEGNDDNHLVSHTRGIDLVLGGHSHTYMKEPVYILNIDQQPVPVVHSGKNGVNVSHMQLVIDSK